jgi:hypothetical protein
METGSRMTLAQPARWLAGFAFGQMGGSAAPAAEGRRRRAPRPAGHVADRQAQVMATSRCVGLIRNRPPTDLPEPKDRPVAAVNPAAISSFRRDGGWAWQYQQRSAHATPVKGVAAPTMCSGGGRGGQPRKAGTVHGSRGSVRSGHRADVPRSERFKVMGDFDGATRSFW